MAGVLVSKKEERMRIKTDEHGMKMKAFYYRGQANRVLLLLKVVPETYVASAILYIFLNCVGLDCFHTFTACALHS